ESEVTELRGYFRCREAMRYEALVGHGRMHLTKPEAHRGDEQDTEVRRGRGPCEGHARQRGADPQHRDRVSAIDEAADEEGEEERDERIAGGHQSEDESRTAEFEGAIGDEHPHTVVGRLGDDGVEDEAWEPGPVGRSGCAHPSVAGA